MELQPPILVYQPHIEWVVGLSEHKANSAQLELELELSLAMTSREEDLNVI